MAFWILTSCGRVHVNTSVAAQMPAQTPAPPLRSSALQLVIDSAVAKGLPGVQAAVIRGQSEWYAVAGESSVEKHTRMQSNSRIRLASITKMFTYATIVELEKKGVLNRSDRAVDRLPVGALRGIPNADSITIDQLLEHTSGIHNFNGDSGDDFRKALYGDARWGRRLWTAAELVTFAKRTGNHPTGIPGQSRSYSSTGYIILEMIAEHATGKRLPVLYDELIFAPLGMKSTVFEGYNGTGRDIVDSYGIPDTSYGAFSPFTKRKAVRSDGLVNLSGGLRYYNAWARGAGAAASTVRDLVSFMRAVEANRYSVISNQADEFRLARARPASSFGWNGGSAGIQASILYSAPSDITVIVLVNGTTAGEGTYDIAKKLLDIARGS